ncbi:hypothetical protein MYSTI_08075 [Myxococcus stipitatus DSM 14675]|uniref:Uncharacterized protein n=1 Tax=Myxococcus stipitatus (strain DSM 14675 / JCM 12634 / Mx s8) TaxID=1278073 RepID=L7UK15_MYXSD|nr:hypothetical protein [Myxococcus stipitatus]AGC49341.1 hypothetical protein MYSTI_08075 [Myxococcus stipitatus DSM 14675]
MVEQALDPMHPRTFVVEASHFRALAQRRIVLASVCLPLLVGGAALTLWLSLNLMALAVLSLFFAYGCITIVTRQRREATHASRQELLLEGDRVTFASEGPRRVFRAIGRPGYLRLLSTENRVAAFWFDARRDPTAFFDVPLPKSERGVLTEALKAAGIPLREEGSIARVLSLVGALALTLGALVVARVALASAALGLGALLSWGGLLAVALVASLLAAIWWATRDT